MTNWIVRNKSLFVAILALAGILIAGLFASVGAAPSTSSGVVTQTISGTKDSEFRITLTPQRRFLPHNLDSMTFSATVDVVTNHPQFPLNKAEATVSVARIPELSSHHQAPMLVSPRSIASPETVGATSLTMPTVTVTRQLGTRGGEAALWYNFTLRGGSAGGGNIIATGSVAVLFGIEDHSARDHILAITQSEHIVYQVWNYQAATITFYLANGVSHSRGMTWSEWLRGDHERDHPSHKVGYDNPLEITRTIPE